MLSVKPKSANANQKKQQPGHGQSGWEFVHGKKKAKDGEERRGSERRTRQMWHVFECAGVGLNQRFPRNCQKKDSEEGERNMWKQWARPLKQSKMIVIMGEGNCNKAAHRNEEHTYSQTNAHTCATYKLHLCGLCPFGSFWRINGSPGPLWRVHFQVRVQLKVQFEVSGSMPPNAQCNKNKLPNLCVEKTKNNPANTKQQNKTKSVYKAITNTARVSNHMQA